VDTNRHTGASVCAQSHKKSLFIGISGRFSHKNTENTEKTAENPQI
jgi:hypothetical protein